MDEIISLLDVKMICVCAIIFCLFWKILERYFFVPYVKVYEEREAKTYGNLSLAESYRQKAADLNHTFDTSIAQVRMEAMQDKLARVNAAKLEAARTIEHTEDSAKKMILEARALLEKEIEALRESALSDTDNLATLITEKVLNPHRSALRHNNIDSKREVH